MENLFIFLLLFLPLLQPLPTTFAPPHRGIFPYYGFEWDCIKETHSIIPNFIRTGVYKIEETDIAWYRNDPDTSTSMYDISLSANGDTVKIYEFEPNRFNRQWDQRDTEIYLKNGRIIGTHPKFSSPFGKLRKYDDHQRIIEEDEIDTLDKIVKIWRKTIYEYPSVNEKIESEYSLIEPERPKFPKIKWAKDSATKARRDSANAAYDTAYSRWKKQYKSMNDEYKLESKVVTKIDTVKRIDEMFFYDYRKDMMYPWGHEVHQYDSHHRVIRLEDLTQEGKTELLETTEYKDDSQGHLLSKTVTRDGEIRYRDEWSYDKDGRCILHTDLNSNSTWTYDKKGNVIEFYEQNKGNPYNKNIFKMYYR